MGSLVMLKKTKKPGVSLAYQCVVHEKEGSCETNVLDAYRLGCGPQ